MSVVEPSYFQLTPITYAFVQYIEGNFTDLQDSLNALYSATQVVDNAESPGSALIIFNQSTVLKVNPNQWVGYNNGQWEVHDDAEMQGYGTTFTPYTPPS